MSDPEIIEMLSRCSHWIGEKLQDYKIERGPGGIPRIWIPEDDDWYRLDAYIDYLENEEEPPESSIEEELPPPTAEDMVGSQLIHTQPSLSITETFMLEEPVEQPAPHPFIYTPSPTVPKSDSFKVRTKFIEQRPIETDSLIWHFVQQHKYLVATFVIRRWRRLGNTQEIHFNIPMFYEEKPCEGLRFEHDVSVQDIWEMVEQRLMLIMTSAAKERMNLFTQMFEMYPQNSPSLIVPCYRDFLRENRVRVQVKLFNKLPGQRAVNFAARIYEEKGTLTPLGDHPSLDSLKKTYRTFTWLKVERNNQN